MNYKRKHIPAQNKIYQTIRQDLIRICPSYITEEDICFLASVNLSPPYNIYKQDEVILVNEMSRKNTRDFKFQFDKGSLDFFISIEPLNHLNDLEPMFRSFGTIIRSGGLLSFTYEHRRDKNFSSQLFNLNKTDVPDSSILASGKAQKLLINNNFYIQHELEYQIDSFSEIELVLIIAQKK